MCDRRGKSSSFGILHRDPNPVSVPQVSSARATNCASQSARIGSVLVHAEFIEALRELHATRANFPLCLTQ